LFFSEVHSQISTYHVLQDTYFVSDHQLSIWFNSKLNKNYYEKHPKIYKETRNHSFVFPIWLKVSTDYKYNWDWYIRTLNNSKTWWSRWCFERSHKCFLIKYQRTYIVRLPQTKTLFDCLTIGYGLTMLAFRLLLVSSKLSHGLLESHFEFNLSKEFVLIRICRLSKGSCTLAILKHTFQYIIGVYKFVALFQA